MKQRYIVNTKPVANKNNVVIGHNYRISILTDGLIRLEYSKNGIFEDRSSQVIQNRDFPKVNYRLVKTNEGIEIHTKRVVIYYNEFDFSKEGLSIQLRGNLNSHSAVWRYTDEIYDLGGTARTLDWTSGPIKLEHGIMSRTGFSLLDDSKSQLINEDGFVSPRNKEYKDLYFFGYNNDFKIALKDFYYLCGSTPLLPRYALGNWWSRYYKYR